MYYALFENKVRNFVKIPRFTGMKIFYQIKIPRIFKKLKRTKNGFKAFFTNSQFLNESKTSNNLQSLSSNF
jgi:hypothetical protein